MSLTRRQLLAGTAGGVALAAAGCTRVAPSPTTPNGSVVGGPVASGVGGQNAAVTPTATRSAYGTAQFQFGDLYRPSGAAHPGVIVVIHGGFWRSQYDLTLGAPLALDLAARGYLTWNLEYRRVGGGGGWPNTLADVAAGIDHLATLGVDTSRVVAVGHSAGGQLAAWAAGRARLPGGAPG
ncbi:MAG: alpha/beta hydrolase, partial [Actinomycetota bacterium]|nr:alpha/beta hydrolase [Actinomycetota bacterium]